MMGRKFAEMVASSYCVVMTNEVGVVVGID
jgi:hypothetical protein